MSKINPDCNTTADVSSFILRTALPAVPFFSDRYDSMINIYNISKFKRILSVKDFRLFSRHEEFLKMPFPLLRSFLFARIRLNPLSAWILCHDSILVIVSKLTFLFQNFLICCCQVTDLLTEVLLDHCASCKEAS